MCAKFGFWLDCNGGFGGGDVSLGDMGSGLTSITAGDEGVVRVGEMLSSLVSCPHTGFFCRFCCVGGLGACLLGCSLSSLRALF